MKRLGAIRRLKVTTFSCESLLTTQPGALRAYVPVADALRHMPASAAQGAPTPRERRRFLIFFDSFGPLTLPGSCNCRGEDKPHP